MAADPCPDSDGTNSLLFIDELRPNALLEFVEAISQARCNAFRTRHPGMRLPSNWNTLVSEVGRAHAIFAKLSSCFTRIEMFLLVHQITLQFSKENGLLRRLRLLLCNLPDAPCPFHPGKKVLI